MFFFVSCCFLSVIVVACSLNTAATNTFAISSYELFRVSDVSDGRALPAGTTGSNGVKGGIGGNKKGGKKNPAGANAGKP